MYDDWIRALFIFGQFPALGWFEGVIVWVSVFIFILVAHFIIRIISDEIRLLLFLNSLIMSTGDLAQRIHNITIHCYAHCVCSRIFQFNTTWIHVWLLLVLARRISITIQSGRDVFNVEIRTRFTQHIKWNMHGNTTDFWRRLPILNFLCVFHMALLFLWASFLLLFISNYMTHIFDVQFRNQIMAKKCHAIHTQLPDPSIEWKFTNLYRYFVYRLFKCVNSRSCSTFL